MSYNVAKTWSSGKETARAGQWQPGSQTLPGEAPPYLSLAGPWVQAVHRGGLWWGMRVFLGAGMARTGSGLPDSRALEKQVSKPSHSAEERNKKKRAKPTEAALCLARDPSPVACRTAHPEGRGCPSLHPQLCPEPPAWLPFIMILPEPGRMGRLGWVGGRKQPLWAQTKQNKSPQNYMG